MQYIVKIKFRIRDVAIMGEYKDRSDSIYEKLMERLE